MDALTLSWLSAAATITAFVLAVLASIRNDARWTVVATLLLALSLVLTDCATVVVVQATGAVDAPATSPQDGRARDGGP